MRFLREVRLAQDGGEVKVGDKVLVDQFSRSTTWWMSSASRRAAGLRDFISGTTSVEAAERTVRCFIARRARLALRHFLRGS